jgi:hypothetical protein
MSFIAVLAVAASTSFIAIEAAAASSAAMEGESDIAGERSSAGRCREKSARKVAIAATTA